MYSNGQGVAKNIKEAITWYQKAAKQEYQQAKEVLKQLGSTY